MRIASRFLSTMKKIGVIINVSAGSVTGQNIADAVRAAFEQHGVQARVEVAGGNKLPQTARAMRDEGFDYIVAGGGDGTVSTVAAELVGHRAALGVLPLGTLNHFARDIGMPLDIEGAVAEISSGEVRAVDVASVNGKVFINNSSLGLYPDQARLRHKWRARFGRWLALIFASIVVMTRYPFLRVIAEFNGKRIKRRCPMLLVSNNEYKLQPGKLTERERLDEGMLGIYLLRHEGRTGLLRIALHSLIYSPEEAASFENDRAAEAVVTTRRKKVHVALDGEVYKLNSPLRYKSLPASLNVVAPKKAVTSDKKDEGKLE
jgi:YegS/Rv2252/BmrU family lipid kinase